MLSVQKLGEEIRIERKSLRFTFLQTGLYRKPPYIVVNSFLRQWNYILITTHLLKVGHCVPKSWNRNSCKTQAGKK